MPLTTKHTPLYNNSMERAKTLICEALDSDSIGLKEVREKLKLKFNFQFDFYYFMFIKLALKTYLEASSTLLIEPKISLDQLLFEDGTLILILILKLILILILVLTLLLTIIIHFKFILKILK